MIIDKNNFFKNTNGRFIECDIPKNNADYISKATSGKISSLYYFINDGVIRVSDHWGGVASCQWNLNTINTMGFDKCRSTELKAGFISFKELECNFNLRNELMICVSKNKTEEANIIREKLNNAF